MEDRARYAAPNVPYLGHHPPPSAPTLGWVEASAATPCPRCGARTGCSVEETGGFVRCRVIRSDHPLVGGGWLHAVPATGAATGRGPPRSGD